MPEPTLLWAGGCPVLKVAGIPPGPFREINYDHLTLQLEPREFLTVLHGWLTDARNTQQAEFEDEGLQQGCASHAEKSMLELLGHLFSTMQKFMGDCPQFEDMTAAIFALLGESTQRVRQSANGSPAFG